MGSEMCIRDRGEHQLDLWLKGLAICTDGEKAVYIDLDRTEAERKEIIGHLKTVLESAEHPKIFYDLKKVLQLFSKLGIQIEGVESDILLAAHMTDPLGRRYDLDYMLGRKLNMKRKSRESSDATKQSQMNMFEESEEENYIRHCEYSAIIFQLHKLLKAQLKQTGMEGAYRNIEIPLAGTLAALEMTGVKLDVEGLNKVALEFEGRLTEFRKKITLLAGQEFNPNSVTALTSLITLIFLSPAELKKIVKSLFSSAGAAPPAAGAAAAGAAAVTPHFSSNCFESSAASTTVSFESSSIILFKSAI